MFGSQRLSLGEVGSTYGGLTGKTKVDFGRGKGRYVTFVEVMADARLIGRSLDRVDVKPGERQNTVKRGDVLFNGSSETPEEVALPAVVDFDVPDGVFLNSFCFGYRLNRSGVVDPTFLAYYFRSSVGRDLVAALAQGAIRYNISKTKLMQLPLVLPSFEEQERIAGALEDADNLIEILERRVEATRAIKRGMMQELLTGRTRLVGKGAA